MTAARPVDYEDEAEELLDPKYVSAHHPDLPARIAKALADAWNKGYRQGREDR